MKEELDILFLNYLSGNLSSDEKLEFENRLSNEPGFKYQYENFRIAKIAGERIHYNEVKSNVLSAINQEKIKRPKLLRFAVPAAAAILLLIAAVFIIGVKPNPEQLYAKYYESPPYSTSRTVQDSTNFWELSKTLYSQEKWGDAVSTIERLDSSQRFQARTMRMLAHSLLNDKQIDRSIETFKQLKSTHSNDQSQIDNWYLALAYLKIPSADSSLVYLEKVADGDNGFLYYNDASKLISELKKLNK